MKEQQINGVAASVIQAAVERIERRDGVCHPARLVAAASRPSSPLHGLFEWDDSEAARKYRVDQARRVIRSIRVVVEDQAQVGPAFVHVTQITAGGVTNGYMTTARALAGESRAEVLRDALAQLQGLRRRYGALTELASVWDALENVERVAA